MNQNIKDLLEQLDRLAGYVGHQGEAAHDGVQVSADHLLYLAKSMTLAVEQLGTAIEDQATERERQIANSRNEPMLRRGDLILNTLRAHHELGEPYTVDITTHGGLRLQMDAGATALLAWFYLLDQPAISSHVAQEHGHGWLSVDGKLDGASVHVTCVFKSDEALQTIRDGFPSVHLARRLQIAGAR